MTGLSHSGNAEEARVERLGFGFSARRHRQLDVVDRPDHRTTIPLPVGHELLIACEIVGVLVSRAVDV
jgi:hypothetical protein